MPAGSDRLARALPALATLAAVALVASQVLAWLGVSRAAKAANRGEAEVLLEALDAHLLRSRGPTSESDLDEFLTAHRDAGLRFVAVDHPFGRIEAGNGRLDDARLGDRFTMGEGRIRAVREHQLPPRRRPPLGGRPPFPPPPGGGPPGPPPLGGGPPPPRPPGGGPPRFGGPRGPPRALHIVEIEPRHGPALRADALRTLIAAGIAAGIFLLLALALRRSIRAREEAARRAERDRHLTALGEMSAVLAHEIKNPLASLKGHAQLLVEMLEDGAKTQAKATRIVGEAVRLEELTSNLLEFVRSGTLRREPVDLARLVRSAADAVEGGRFELEGTDAPVPIVADGPRLQQAFLNVLLNASQASDEPARVTLERVGDGVTIQVSDSGPGLPEGTEDLSFEPFQTTRVRGTGLGLAITKRIIDAHEGSISARNRSEGGAELTIRLPLEPSKEN